MKLVGPHSAGEAKRLRRKRKTVIGALSVSAVLAVGLLASCSTVQSNLPPQPAVHVIKRFTANNWGTLETNADVYAGTPVSFVGQVFSPFDRAATPPNIQVFVVPMGAGAVAVVAVDADPGVKPGGYVAVQGTVLGGFRGQGPFQGTEGMTPVLVQATSVAATAGPASESR